MKLTAEVVLKLVAGLALLALVGLLVWVIFIRPAQLAQQAVQGRTDSAYSDAQARASDAATGAVSDLGERQIDRNNLERDNADAIDAVPGASLPLDRELNDTGLRGLCKRASYRDTVECVQLLGPNPTKP